MTDSAWTKQGVTLSLNNACKEFGLSEQEIIQSIQQGKLQYRLNYAHGNPYYKLLRKEVQALAQALYGDDYLKKQALEHELLTVNKEINSLKRKLSKLEKQKAELSQKLGIA
ncbi:hypothetical protein U737_14995 [Methylomonas sp. LW13]|uniref:hypothetical protein n=1 Tax=unclassified Methylomonas TaxID=2608980 RepID=UPI00051B9E48|nr:hypothetical protein [Methylomonas sp. LW13]QBC28097.1 hypothetical protein U737_14995 [Methylomonas sp. LW13]